MARSFGIRRVLRIAMARWPAMPDTFCDCFVGYTRPASISGDAMIRIALCIATAVLFAAKLPTAPPSADTDRVWALEKAYWHYVQADDLNGYRTLWHANFLGWPYTSSEPVRKAQITDWIAAREKNGETLKSYDLEQLSIQVTGNVTTTMYRIHETWLNKSGAENIVTARVTHTWLRDSAGSWQIISGMSAPTNAEGH
jgi:ketosteroid isomerase-like protein